MSLNEKLIMKEELNIAAILKDKPKGTKLWSPMVGECKLLEVENNDDFELPIRTINKKVGVIIFRKDGKYAKCGEVCLFPSKQMQDWSKFAWKKGDVLSCGVDNLCIFNKFENDEYDLFDAEFVTPGYTGARLNTAKWTKVTDEDTIKQHISKIEEVKGGKLNLETLEIEHSESKQKFKDGDMVYCPAGDIIEEVIFIAKAVSSNVLHSYICMSKDGMLSSVNPLFSVSGYLDNLRLATDSEKQQLFSALEKEGKRWNPDSKSIEDLPKKCELKPFDKVLVRDRDTNYWVAGIFSHYIESSKCFYCTTGSWKQCIPYNEETQHLLGTTDEWKGGEG